ncbi:MAG: hypothetical protein H7249_04680 [Chitinophagaceae bacterium]|nr:hypothetical protein [Oligoflexus sp.]
MHRYRKLIGIIVGIILTPIILVALALVVINVVNWDKHRPLVTSLVEKFTDFKVDKIEGIHVGLLTSAEAGVDALKIRQTNPYSSLKNFESKQAFLKIKVFPFIFKHSLIVQNFVLDGARIDLAPAPDDPQAKEKKNEGTTLADLPSIFIISATIDQSTLVSVNKNPKTEPFRLHIQHAGVTSPSHDKASMLNAKGKVSNLPFEVLGAFGSFDAFRDTKAAYPARIQAKIADHNLEARGNLHFAEGISHFDVDASGPGLTKLKQALRINIGDIPAYNLSFVLDKKPNDFRFTEIKANVGRSSAAGRIELNFEKKRPFIWADLVSDGIYQLDLAGLFKTDKTIKDPEDVPRPEGQYFSDKPIDAVAFKKVDADINLNIRHYEGVKAGHAIDGANARITLTNGKLVADPLRFAVSEGTIGGDLLFDARNPDINVKIELGARRIDLDKLLAPVGKEIPVLKIKPTDVAKGLLTGHMSLAMHGRTPMAMSKTVTGPVELAIENGKLSATIIELGGLDIAESLGDYVIKNPMKELQCGLLSFQASHGVYQTRTFLLATTDTNFVGEGQLDLPGNKADFHLKAHPRDFSIGSIRSPIYIRGPLNHIKAGLEAKPIVLRGVAAVALGFINPALALIPLIEPGLGKNGECGKYMAELKEVQSKAKQDVSRQDLEATKNATKSVGR